MHFLPPFLSASMLSSGEFRSGTNIELKDLILDEKNGDITDENSGVSFQGIDTQAIIGFIRQKIGHDFEENTPQMATLEVPI